VLFRPVKPAPRRTLPPLRPPHAPGPRDLPPARASARPQAPGGFGPQCSSALHFFGGGSSSLMAINAACMCRYNAAQTRCVLLINRRANLQRANLQRANLRRSNYQDILGIEPRTKGPHALAAGSWQLAAGSWQLAGRHTGRGRGERSSPTGELSARAAQPAGRPPCVCSGGSGLGPKGTCSVPSMDSHWGLV
jgi:hypothetical protein